MVDYPLWTDAPAVLRGTDGNCGLISVWLALQSLGISCEENEIRKSCAFRQGEATFLVCIGVGLHDLGLKVEFRTDADPQVQPDELICCEEAKKRQIAFLPALPIERLLKSEASGGRVILLLEGEGGEGHLSPVSCIDQRSVWVVYNEPAVVSIEDLENRRRHAGICRQSLTVFAQ
jgi:hypothetical protein